MSDTSEGPGVEIRNTWSMRLDPQPAPEFHMMDPDDDTKLVELLPVMTGEVFGRLVNYAVIVEGWDKRKLGRQRRAWEKEFTSAERNKIGRYYGRFYRWHLVSGTPLRVSCRLNTLHLLQRAVNFFATI